MGRILRLLLGVVVLLCAARLDALAQSAAPVRLHDRTVFELRTDADFAVASKRAADASAKLERAVESGADEARLETRGDRVVLYVGDAPIVDFGPEDTTTGSEVDVRLVGESALAALKAAIDRERTRGQVADWVFSVSLAVFAALAAYLVARRLGGLAETLQERFDQRTSLVGAVRVAGVEVVSAFGIRSALRVGFAVAMRFGQALVAYVWLVFALSLFPATQSVSARLTHAVVSPIGVLGERVLTFLPVLVTLGVGTALVAFLTRLVGAFFEGVARGESAVHWLAADRARAAGRAVQGIVVLVALVLAAPLAAGTTDGVLGRIGAFALLAVGLSCVPVLANALVGMSVVFLGKARRGDLVVVGGAHGVVQDISLFAWVLDDGRGSTLRVPHLLALASPVRIVPSVSAGSSSAASGIADDVVLICVDRTARDAVWACRDDLVPRGGAAFTLRLAGVGNGECHFVLARVPSTSTPQSARVDLVAAISDALERSGVTPKYVRYASLDATLSNGRIHGASSPGASPLRSDRPAGPTP